MRIPCPGDPVALSRWQNGAADGRVNLMGKVTLVGKEEREELKEVYLAKHPGAFWVDFGE